MKFRAPEAPQFSLWPLYVVIGAVLCLTFAPAVAVAVVGTDTRPPGAVQPAQPGAVAEANAEQAVLAAHREAAERSQRLWTCAALMIAFAPAAFWGIGRFASRWDGPRCGRRAAPSVDDPRALLPFEAAPKGALAYLREGTHKRGDFVILAHAAEDLEKISPEQLEAAVAQAREEDPTLEHRVVADRWILRRPRI
jgi:hypothetical protein